MTIDWMTPSAEMLAGRDAGRNDRQHEVEELEAENARLEAIVDKLPKYADTGAPIVPGMVVWFRKLPGSVPMARRGAHGHPVLLGDTVIGIHCWGEHARIMFAQNALVPWVLAARCYSTKEAAEAAGKDAEDEAEQT